MAVDGSQDSTASSGAAFTWILEHLMAYPGTYEIPLRTMYTLNSNPRAQPSSHRGAFHPSEPGYNALATPQSPTHDNSQRDEGASAEAARFKANLMSQVAQLPTQPCSLPPSFTTSFIRRCFPPELEQVDFPQALTALDYLKDIETRRRSEVLSSLKRLGIDKQNASERGELGKTYPGVLAWISSLEEKEKKIEALYSQVYVGLRRWILINEMLWEPFHKANCLAMLNTLYPPTNPPQFTPYITDAILAAHRHGFTRYIFSIEKQGTKILDPLIKQGIREGEVNGWPSVRDTVEKYLRMANGVIEECLEVNEKDSLEGDERMRKSRKVDSGISFTSSGGPSMSGSGSSRGSTSSSIHSAAKFSSKAAPPPAEVKDLKPGGSTLERIAKEIRKMRSRGDLRDSSKDAAPKSKTLKKMRSASILGERDKNLGSSASDPPPFDVDEFKRKRMIWEAQNAKKADHSKHPSDQL